MKKALSITLALVLVLMVASVAFAIPSGTGANAKSPITGQMTAAQITGAPKDSAAGNKPTLYIGDDTYLPSALVTQIKTIDANYKFNCVGPNDTSGNPIIVYDFEINSITIADKTPYTARLGMKINDMRNYDAVRKIVGGNNFIIFSFDQSGPFSFMFDTNTSFFRLGKLSAATAQLWRYDAVAKKVVKTDAALFFNANNQVSFRGFSMGGTYFFTDSEVDFTAPVA